jgi:archaellum biogenesis protein FlaJ (TadC family)
MTALNKYVDFHTAITALIVVAIVVLKLAKADVPVELYVLLAAVSPGLVLKGKVQRDEEERVKSLRPPPPDVLPPPVVIPPPPPPPSEAA